MVMICPKHLQVCQHPEVKSKLQTIVSYAGNVDAMKLSCWLAGWPVSEEVNPATLTDSVAAFSHVAPRAADLFPPGGSSDGGDGLPPPWTTVTRPGVTFTAFPCKCCDSPLSICCPGRIVRPPTLRRRLTSTDKSGPRARRRGAPASSFKRLCRSWGAERRHRHMKGTSEQQVEPLKATKILYSLVPSCN